MYMYSMEYLEKELQKYGYIVYPPTGGLGRTRFIKLYGAGNIHIHVCYEETALGPIIESIDILDFDEDDLGKPLQRYVATSESPSNAMSRRPVTTKYSGTPASRSSSRTSYK